MSREPCCRSASFGRYERLLRQATVAYLFPWVILGDRTLSRRLALGVSGRQGLVRARLFYPSLEPPPGLVVGATGVGRRGTVEGVLDPVLILDLALVR